MCCVHLCGRQVIPGRGSAYISVVFSADAVVVPPQSASVDCRSYSLGYMTVAESAHDVPGRVHRAHQYDLAPLSVTMTATVMRAVLSVDYHDDDRLTYSVPAGDLLDHNNQVTYYHCYHYHYRCRSSCRYNHYH